MSNKNFALKCIQHLKNELYKGEISRRVNQSEIDIFSYECNFHISSLIFHILIYHCKNSITAKLPWKRCKINNKLPWKRCNTLIKLTDNNISRNQTVLNFPYYLTLFLFKSTDWTNSFWHCEKHNNIAFWF